ncbi:MAG: sulfotransferase family protein [Deltaproteobacteria bacterium]|nr:MAG: sulfotransferase family protein [Deltaproteobacteria bacterium]
MALKVIGAGFGRTGTESLKAALEQLGFGPCDHMFELIKTAHRVRYLEDLARGETTDFDALFAGFGSAVDFPYAMHYRELMAAYPEAKVVLTVRDADAWVASATSTILRGLPPGARWAARAAGLVYANARGVPRWMDYVEHTLMNGFFEGRTRDHAYLRQRFLDWNAEVQATVPAKRLLVFEVKDGWEPLCGFLGVGVPDAPFPRTNSGASFEERTKLRNLPRLFR